MPDWKRWKELPILLAIVLAIGTLVVDVAYWAAAVDVSPTSCEQWTSAPPGRYLPWPEKSGPFMMIVAMSPLDSAICFLATSGLIVLLIALDVVLLAWIGRFLGKRMERWREENR